MGIGQVPRVAYAKGSHVLCPFSAEGHTPPGPGLGGCFLGFLVHYRGSRCFPFEINCPYFCSHVLDPTHCIGHQNLDLGTVPFRHSARCPRTQTHAFYARQDGFKVMTRCSGFPAGISNVPIVCHYYVSSTQGLSDAGKSGL